MKTSEERFFAKVEKTESCWLWTAAKNVWGYGVFWFEGKNLPAHHFLVRAKKPSHLLALHTCDQPACVNPSHILFGTQKDNMHDMHKKGRANPKPGWQGMMRLRVTSRGEQHPKHKLTEEQVRLIRAQKNRVGLMAELARHYGLSHQGMTNVYRGKSWKFVKELKNNTTTTI